MDSWQLRFTSYSFLFCIARGGFRSLLSMHPSRGYTDNKIWFIRKHFSFSQAGCDVPQFVPACFTTNAINMDLYTEITPVFFSVFLTDWSVLWAFLIDTYWNICRVKGAAHKTASDKIFHKEMCICVLFNRNKPLELSGIKVYYANTYDCA